MVSEDTIEVLLVKQALREVLQNYTRSIDRLDRELMETVWWPDATVRYESYIQGSPQEVIDDFMQAHRRYASHHHQLGNMKVMVAGDTAASETYVTATLRSVPDENGCCVDRVFRGRYLDHWSKRDGRWAIDHRHYLTDVFSEYEVLTGDALPMEQLPDRQDLSTTQAGRDRNDPSYGLFEGIRPAVSA